MPRIFILLLILAGCPCQGDEHADEIKRLFEDALSAQGFTCEDLNFKKDLLDDPNLSPLVRTILNHPLESLTCTKLFQKRWDQPPWENDELKAEEIPCQVRDWNDVPEGLREKFQKLLNHLLWEKKRTDAWLPSNRKLKQKALRAFALDNFHVDRDSRSLKFWGERSGRLDDLEEWVRKADELELSETETIQAQLDAGWKLKPQEMEMESRRTARVVHEFVSEVLPWVKSHARQAAFDIIVLDTDLGRVMLGGTGSQKYRGSAALIVDLGGNDEYEQAGCAFGLDAESFSVAVDLGGNDRYIRAGCGIWGFGFLWDESGNDRYDSENASLGCGLFGSGTLIDRSGKDVYRCDTIGEGAASYGFGLLWDGEGDDRYRASMFGQGFAGVHGYGVLCDFHGDDLYYAGGKYPDFDRLPGSTLSLSQGFAMGSRPFAPGGVGLLYDKKGNDEYRSDIFGQGASYWYSCGMLIDGEGSDQYVSGQYNQGAGIHMSVGILHDEKGNDQYRSSNGLAQGSAHDYSVGLLWDGAGNDVYSAASASQGSGINNSVGLLCDGSGNDSYTLTRPRETDGQGMGLYSPWRGFGSGGVLLDLGGKDHYSSGLKNQKIVCKADFGLRVDVENPDQLREWSRPELKSDMDKIEHPAYRGNSLKNWMKPFKSDPFDFGEFRRGRVGKEPRTDEEMIRKGGDPGLGLLLARAARYGDDDRRVKIRGAARKELNELPVEQYEELFPWLGRIDLTSRDVVESILYQKKEAALSVLRDFLEDDWNEIRVMCLKVLFDFGNAEDVPRITPSLSRQKIRVLTLLLIKKWGVGVYGHKVLPFVKGESAAERSLSVRILSQDPILKNSTLISMLEDRDWNVREAAVDVLRERGDKAAQELKFKMLDLSPLGCYWAGRVFKEEK